MNDLSNQSGRVCRGLTVSAGTTLLGALSANKIFLPSACGGGGSCSPCKCRVTQGGQDILPTELPHLSRRERSENACLACQMKVKENMKIRIPDEIFSIPLANPLREGEVLEFTIRIATPPPGRPDAPPGIGSS